MNQIQDAKTQFDAQPISRFSFVKVSPRRYMIVIISRLTGIGDIRRQVISPAEPWLLPDIKGTSTLFMDLRENPYKTFTEGEVKRLWGILSMTERHVNE